VIDDSVHGGRRAGKGRRRKNEGRGKEWGNEHMSGKFSFIVSLRFFSSAQLFSFAKKSDEKSD
jgi:hypothetical protein